MSTGVRDQQVRDLAIRLMKITTKSGIDIGQCAEAHMRCLVSLAIEQKQVPPEDFVVMLGDDLRGLFAAVIAHTIAVKKGEDVH